MDSISFQQHQHKKCLKKAMEVAENLCSDQGERLTAIRKAVLELVWASHEPVKAYDLLEELKKIHPASQPPTVYRALDFLQTNGLVHKIESKNAYLGCGEPSVHHNGQFLICRSCGSVAELFGDETRQLVEKAAGEMGFSVEKTTVEIEGVCQRCQKS